MLATDLVLALEEFIIQWEERDWTGNYQCGEYYKVEEFRVQWKRLMGLLLPSEAVREVFF